jgi:uncharacterized protein (DUF58 family)
MIRTFYVRKFFYFTAAGACLLFAAGYFIPSVFPAGYMVLILLIIATAADALVLFSRKNGIRAERIVQRRLSIGDENKVTILIRNQYAFAVRLSVIDELPVQFQERKWLRKLGIDRYGEGSLHYSLLPVSRGEYVFHDINIYVHGPLRLAMRRYIIPAADTVKVYPSYIQMRRYRLLAISNKLQETGIKRIRRIGHSLEFEQIKEYVRGDDYRTINWKATARKANLMVNNYTDERSQQIYCLINKGRVMKMPFEGLTLLDYAINTTLALCNVALVKQDKAGLITFEKNIDTFLPADKKPTQMNLVLESLYRQQTAFLEPDLEKLYSVIRNRITHRSLLVLFTNYESPESLQREMPALLKMARYHLLLVVFFENTELASLINREAKTLEDIYTKTIAEKFVYEKKLMVKELQQNGILSILTPPAQLTVNTINKYMELKKRMSI